MNMPEIRKIARVYDARLTTITPVHIGTGDVLMKDIDFLVEKGRTRRLDVDKILDELWDETQSRKAEPPRPAELLQSIPRAEWDSYTAYMATGAMRANTSGSQVREQIKTPDHLPYIPGSSLKGALRTALAWAAWSEHITQPLSPQNDFDHRAKFAGQRLEDRLLRPGKQRSDGPNKDVLRALQVGDLHMWRMGQGFRVCNVNVVGRSATASPVEVEAIDAEALFRGQITIHDALFEEPALGFASRKPLLDNLLSHVNAHSLAELEGLTREFSQRTHEGARNILTFCNELTQMIQQIAPNQCLLRLGWGTGWDNKTFGSRLSEGPAGSLAFFEREVVERHRLYRGKRVRQVGDPFPTTRRVMVVRDADPVKLKGMFGWVRLTLIEQAGRSYISVPPTQQ